MSIPIKLSLQQARALALRAQGLQASAAFGTGLAGTLNTIEHLGYVQVDTISVVERAHHHVLWSRVPDYAPEWLDILQRQRSIFEYWDHAASILPMRDFRYSLPVMRSYRQRFHWSDDTPELRQAMRRVLGRIRRDGALRSRDFAGPEGGNGGMWSFSKIEKRALHELWMRGSVLISGREGFQKIYDLPDRVLPPGIDHTMPTEAQSADFHIDRTLRAHGLARAPELSYLRRGAFSATVRRRLTRAISQKRVLPVMVEGSTVPAYARAEDLAELPAGPPGSEAKILSPFDNLVIQRERLRWLFDFNYQLECYLPAGKRRYGHFVLPVLQGDRFIARIEVKARRKDDTLALIGLWFEPGFEKDGMARQALREALERFAIFNGCGKVEMSSLS